jgi:alkanesulfonate monooxygenase SsuD/methylene tetrahydromethanopterin reductase-like flavin-dependent oxidoreductase (luciferase family)
MYSTHMYCAPTTEQAVNEAGPNIEGYFMALGEATKNWMDVTSKDYPNHPAMVAEATQRSIGEMLAGNAVWVGSPGDIAEKIATYQAGVGKIDSASIQANFHTLALEQASASLRLFGKEVMPRFVQAALRLSRISFRPNFV